MGTTRHSSPIKDFQLCSAQNKESWHSRNKAYHSFKEGGWENENTTYSISYPHRNGHTQNTTPSKHEGLLRKEKTNFKPTLTVAKLLTALFLGDMFN